MVRRLRGERGFTLTELMMTCALVVDAVNGAVDPSRINWTDNEARLSGTISRYVTWTNDLCEQPSCEPAEQRAKRITVAVTVNGPEAPRKPIVISTIKSDPESTG